MLFNIGNKKVYCNRPDKVHAKQALENFYSLYFPLIYGRKMIALDIGAACGDSSIIMASCLTRKSKVICFEPGREALPFLCENIAKNLFCFYDIHTVAASNFDGNIGFISTAENGGVMTNELIPLRGKTQPEYHVDTVDTINYLRMIYSSSELNNIYFIKVDCEGYDYIILENLRPLILANKPIIIAENWPDINIQNKLYNVMLSFGYKAVSSLDNQDIIFTP